MLAVLGAVVFFGWVRTWSALLIPDPGLIFGDMEAVRAAIGVVQQGLNPQLKSFNGWPPLNYPFIWVQIGEALDFPNYSHFLIFCGGLVACFVSIWTYLLLKFPSYWLLACVLSSAVLLAIERGNNDLVVFCFVFLSIRTRGRFSPVFILVATALKLYPAFCIAGLLIRRQYFRFAITVIGAVAIFAWLADQLKAIREYTPVVFSYTYGISSLGAFSLTHPRVPHWTFFLVAAAIVVCVIVCALYLSRSARLWYEAGLELDLFLAGASIYVGTFIFSCNWDYRLIFPVLCVPAFCIKQFPFGRWLAGLLITALNYVPLFTMFGLAGALISAAAKTALFSFLCAYLVVLVLARTNLFSSKAAISMSSPSSASL
jgi:hypothetical protein